MGLKDFVKDQLDPTGISAPKGLYITDRRVGVLDMFLKFIVVVYVGINIFLNKAYLETVPPVGTTAQWAGTGHQTPMRFDASGKCSGTCGTADYATAKANMKTWSEANDMKFAYCNNSAYEFTYSAEWVYGPYSCAYPSSGEVWSKTRSTVFFTTAVEISKDLELGAPAGVSSDSGCTAAFPSACPSGATYSAESGFCNCRSVKYDFMVATEHLSLEFDHSFTSLFSSAVNTGSAFKPRTIFRQKGCEETSEGSCDFHTTNKGESVVLPLQKLLLALNVDLDGDACNQNGGNLGNAVNGVCPKVRVTGMQIDMFLSFYNFNQQSNSISAGDREPYCIVDVLPKITWNSLGNDITFHEDFALGTRSRVNNYRYGIRISFKSESGKISKFNFTVLVNTFIGGLVLFGFSSKISVFVATNLLGTASKTYAAAMSETLSLPKEMAKFACQALVAHEAFMHMDEDGSGSLSQSEMFHKLKQLLQKDMDDDSISRLCAAIFEVVDMRGIGAGVLKKGDGQQQAWDGEKERGLDVTEFVEAITEDRLSVPALKKIIDSKFSGQGDDAASKALGVMLNNVGRIKSGGSNGTINSKGSKGSKSGDNMVVEDMEKQDGQRSQVVPASS